MTLADPLAKKKALIEAARLKNQPKAEDAAIQRTRDFINPSEAKNKIRIVFDNSGSMNSFIDSIHGASNSTKMEEAKKGVIEFLRNCTPNQDAVAIHMLNAGFYWDKEESTELSRVTISSLIINSTLSSDLIRLASAIDNPPELPATGGTPLFETLEIVLEAEPRATRLITFSDGQPNSTIKMGVVISLSKRYAIPIDTVFFGSALESGASIMKELAESTGGIYLAFDPSKGVSFASAFKYLTEGKRLQLMDKSFKEKLERGEVR